MLHLANLLMSMFSAGQFEITSTYKPNPCSFYLLNLGIDVSVWIIFYLPTFEFQVTDSLLFRPLLESQYLSSSFAF